MNLQATTAQKLHELAVLAEKESLAGLEKLQTGAIHFHTLKQKDDEERQLRTARQMAGHYMMPNYRWTFGTSSSSGSRRRRRNQNRNHQNSTDKIEKKREGLLAKQRDPKLKIPLEPTAAAAPSTNASAIPAHETVSLQQRLRAPMATWSPTTTPVPLARKQLRFKRSIRCRSTGKLLVKPDLNPQHGDSTKKTNVGSWFRIQNLARSFLPRVQLWRAKARRSPQPTDGSEKAGSDGMILLRIRNPAMQRHSPVDGEIKVYMALRDNGGTLVAALPSEAIVIAAEDSLGLSPKKGLTQKQQHAIDAKLGVLRRGQSYVVLQVRVRARYGHHLIWKLPLSILVSYNVPEYIHQPGALSFSYNLDVIADVRKYLQSSSA